MNKEEIKAGNKLIFDFLGKEYAHWTFENRTSWISARTNLNRSVCKAFDGYEDLKYHKSWDWIMSVVEKIHSIDYTDVQIHSHICYINYRHGEYKADFHRWEGLPMVEMVYIAVITFIEWYNIQIKQ